MFVYYRYKYNSEKEQVNESPRTVEYIDSIDSIMPRTSVRIHQLGRTGSGRDSWVLVKLGFGKVGFCETFAKQGTLQRSKREVLRDEMFKN